MDAQQLLEIFARQHDLLAREVRVYIQTRIDRTTQHETAQAQHRVLELLAQAETHRDIFSRPELARLRMSCEQMVDALDTYLKQQRDPPLAQHPTVVTRVATGGRPRIEFEPEWLAVASSFTGPKGIAKHVLGVHPRTIRRRQLEAGIGVPQPAVMSVDGEGRRVRNIEGGSRRPAQPVPVDELDAHVAGFMNQFPNHGRSLMEGQVLSVGLKLGHEVTRADVAASMNRISGLPGHFGRRAIARRKYHVCGPGSLWHHDGQHGLIHWKLVTHAFVDGYSRRVMGIRTSNNNRAATVLDLFLEIVEYWGFPSRVRGDHGVENLLVATVQEEVRGAGRGSYIWGPSTGNTRVERIWVDVVVGYVGKWKAFFLDLEANHGLRRDDDAHIWLLHYLYIGSINQDGLDWAQGWNMHHFTHLPPDQHERGAHLESPNEMYFYGVLHKGIRTMQADDMMIVNEDEELDDDEIADYGAGADEDEEEARRVRRFQHDHAPPEDAGDIADEERNANGWGRPRRMFEVRVPEPEPPFPQELVDGLDAHLQRRVDLDAQTMPLRRLWWIEAVAFLSRD